MTDWTAELLAGLPPLLTVDEVAAMLRCSRRSVYRLTAGGSLPALRQHESGSSRVLIPRHALSDYLERLEVKAA